MSKKNYKKYDLGLSMLRMLMCFGVVLAHSWRNKGYDSIIFLPFKEIQVLAAPMFMLLSFYFSESLFFSSDDKMFIQRIKRLSIPLIGWAFIYWMVLEPMIHPPIKELLWQIFLGHSFILNASMWFQFNLIVLTVIFYLIFKYLDKQKSIYCVIFLAVLSLILQFTGINFNIFTPLPKEAGLALGRIIEMLPYAAIGLLIRHYKISDILYKHRYLYLLIAVILLPVPYIIYIPGAPGFGYSGIIIIYLCVLMFVIFKMFPFLLLPTWLKTIMFTISNYTLGIYCIHRLIYQVLEIIVPSLVTRSFIFSIGLYIVSYLLSALIAKFPDKKVRSLVI